MRRLDEGPSGIASLQPRVPIGAVVTIGIQGPKGPINRDRFYFMTPSPDRDGSRKQHPRFAAWNSIGEADDPESRAKRHKRRALEIVIAHVEKRDFARQRLTAYRPPGLRIADGSAPPTGAPWCQGDGHTAQRWDRDAQAFTAIPCPDRACEYRSEIKDDRGRPVIPCKANTTLVFQPVWRPDATGYAFPSPLCLWTSNGWHSAANLAGMIEDVERNAAALGVDAFSWYGFRAEMTLTEETAPDPRAPHDPRARRVFPVVHFSPLSNVQAHLAAQLEARRELGSGYAGMVRGAIPGDPEAPPDQARAGVLDAEVMEIADRVALEISGPR